MVETVKYRAPVGMGVTVAAGDIIDVECIAVDEDSGVALLLSLGNEDEGEFECSSIFLGRIDKKKNHYVAHGSEYINISNDIGRKIVGAVADGGVTRKGFVAVVNQMDGGLLYLTSQDGLGSTNGYLGGAPDNEHIRDLVSNAISDVLTIKEFMRDHYRDDVVDFDSARVVRYFEHATIEEIPEGTLEDVAAEAEHWKAIKDAEDKLTTEECDLLYAHWREIEND